MGLIDLCLIDVCVITATTMPVAIGMVEIAAVETHRTAQRVHVSTVLLSVRGHVPSQIGLVMGLYILNYLWLSSLLDETVKSTITCRFCDDNNNLCGCDWDGGDCCGAANNYKYCNDCACLDPDLACPSDVSVAVLD